MWTVQHQALTVYIASLPTVCPPHIGTGVYCSGPFLDVGRMKTLRLEVHGLSTSLWVLQSTDSSFTGDHSSVILQWCVVIECVLDSGNDNFHIFFSAATFFANHILLWRRFWLDHCRCLMVVYSLSLSQDGVGIVWPQRNHNSLLLMWYSEYQNLFHFLMMSVTCEGRSLQYSSETEFWVWVWVLSVPAVILRRALIAVVKTPQCLLAYHYTSASFG